MYIAFHPYFCQSVHVDIWFWLLPCRCACISFSVSFVLLHLGVTLSIDGLPIQRVERLQGVGGLT
jgi:hypothetical protein